MRADQVQTPEEWLLEEATTARVQLRQLKLAAVKARMEWILSAAVAAAILTIATLLALTPSGRAAALRVWENAGALAGGILIFTAYVFATAVLRTIRGVTGVAAARLFIEQYHQAIDDAESAIANEKGESRERARTESNHPRPA